ncbi:MAG: hypothetical protein KJ626_09870 [Verrucomicrobia bacterium]|nr:hypothetical protein [Verrucomicrobiota bacterium]
MKIRDIRLYLAVSILLSACAIPLMAQTKVNVDEVLLLSYLRLNIVKQITAQTSALATDSDPQVLNEVKLFADKWSENRIQKIRSDLEGWFDTTAKERFRHFVAGYTTAEKEGDAKYLNMLAESLSLGDPVPQDYAALRQSMVNRYLVTDVKEGSRLLSDVQSWVEKKKTTGAGPLSQYVSAGTQGETPTTRPPARRAPPKPRVVEERDPLMEAEADFEDVEYKPEGDDLSPLDAYSSMRKAKREKILKEAQEGMKLVADERKAAEEEYAAKKMAAAEAEASAVKEHTKDLSDADKVAQEQRENNWGNRLKKIVGTTVGAAGGALFGGVGTRAGEEAADALFE